MELTAGLSEDIVNITLSTDQWQLVRTANGCNKVKAKTRNGNEWALSNRGQGESYWVVSGSKDLELEVTAGPGPLFYVLGLSAIDVLEVIFE